MCLQNRGMRTTIGIIILILTSNFLTAQQKLEVSVLGGAAYYGGDLNESSLNFDFAYPYYGAGLRYNFNSSYSAKFQFLKGTIGGDDATTPNAARGLYFKSDFMIISAAAEILPWRKNRFNKIGDFQKSFSPYFSAGIAMIQCADEVKTRRTTDIQTLPEPDNKNVFLSLPFGVGVRYDFHPQFSAGLEGIWYATFSDYLDGVSKYGNPSKNDWIMSAAFYVSYFFGAPEADFNFGGKSKF